jgi:sulfur relay (sulfurtransferase) DsrF/TusC family protein
MCANMPENGINITSLMNWERMQPKIFSLDDNPFHLLKASYRSSVTDISNLIEDAELDGIYPEEDLQKARQALVTPRTRLMLELTWLPELSQLQTSKLSELLRNADPTVILSQIGHFPELAKANIAAHLCSHGRSSVEVVHSLAQSWDEIDEGHILTFLNKERRSSGFPKIEAEQLREVLRDVRQRHAAAAANWIWTLPVPGTVMNTVVEHELESNPDSSFLRHFVEIYDKESEPQLAIIKDSIIAATEAAQEVSHDLMSHIKNIEKLLETWDAINQPVQIYSQFRGQEEGRSKQIYEIVRKLCLGLANDHGRYDEALNLSTALLKTFPELESVAESLKGDITSLETLAEQKKLSDQLDPLVEACDRAKNNATSLSKSLKIGGFTVGGGKVLSDVVKSFNAARKGLPEPGVAFLVIRDLALSLNNESNDPQAAFLLLDGVLCLSGGNVPKEILDKLRQERSVVHKNWKMKELDRQNGNLNEMLKIVDEMLVYSNSTDRNYLQKLKSKIERKRFAKKVKFAIYTGIAGVIGFFVLADEFMKPTKRTTYRPPSSNQITTAPAPARAPVVSNAYQEDIPPVGSGLSLNRNQVRYCIYQGARLDYIRPLTANNRQIDRLNGLIDDYNRRCSSFRYSSGVLGAVQGELSSRRAVLREEARRMVASW